MHLPECSGMVVSTRNSKNRGINPNNCNTAYDWEELEHVDVSDVEMLQVLRQEKPKWELDHHPNRPDNTSGHMGLHMPTHSPTFHHILQT